MRLSLTIHAPELIRPFIISTGARTHQPYLAVTLTDGVHSGRGAAAGLRYFGENPETMREQIEAVREKIEADPSREALMDILPAGGARSAVDAALWELEAARDGTTVAAKLGLDTQAVASAFTIVLDSPAAMAAQAKEEAWRPLLKVKVGGSPELEAKRLVAVAEAAPQARRVIDANAGWTVEQLTALAPLAAVSCYELLEQPLAIGSEVDPVARAALLDAVTHLPLCADESFQTSTDFETLDGLYQAVNIKLEKCGGLTAALDLRDGARARGLQVFIGCMLAPTVAIAPAHLLAQTADYADLDGPFWFRDEPVMLTKDGLFAPIDPVVWGQGIQGVRN